jgi:acetyl-CoA acetyltransferase
MCAERFPYLHTVPALALQAALKKAGLTAAELDLLEINEAFASVAVHANRMLGTAEEIVNVNGSSVALGHRPRIDRRAHGRDARARDAQTSGKVRRRHPVRWRRPGLCAHTAPRRPLTAVGGRTAPR